MSRKKMKKQLIAKNKSSQSLYRIHSYEDAKKHFPNTVFTKTKRAWRLFLDIEALSECLLEDFTKQFLLFDNNGENYYIVVNIGDQVDETNIVDKNLMKAATLLMKDYSVSKTFIEFIKKNKNINEDTRIKHIKKFVPEVYLDYVIENNVELNLWDWLPRNLIKKQLLSDPKYLSFLIKKDSEKNIEAKEEIYNSNKNTNESSLFIINYILSGTLTKKTMNFLKDLFKDETVLNMFQKTIDAITNNNRNRYLHGCSLTKSIVKNIFILEDEKIIKINEFDHSFIGILEEYFKEEYLDYLDILINKKTKYVIKYDSKAPYVQDTNTKKLFFDTKRFEYLISYAEDLDGLIKNWKSRLSNSLFCYCFKEHDKSRHSELFYKENFNIENLALLLKDPLRSKFVFIEDLVAEVYKNTYDRSKSRNFQRVITQMDLSLILDSCPDDKFFKENIVKHYTSILYDWDGKNSNNTKYLERIKSVFDLDPKNLQYINLNYLFEKKYSHLDEIFNFDYNSISVQKLFNSRHEIYTNDKENDYNKEKAITDIKRMAEYSIFLKKYDASKWNNKELVELLDPIVNFNTNFDLSDLKAALLTENIERVTEYCNENRKDIHNVFKHKPDNEFMKSIIKIAETFRNR
jgi:ribosomal protein S15P/S13E